MASSAYVYVPSYGYTYSFTGVLSINHTLSLKTDSDAEAATGIDYVNAARNAPNQVTLEIIESDVGHAAGWAARMAQAMEALKRNRTICTVSTKYFTYESMLLTEFTMIEDATSQSGWQGSLTFTQFAVSGSGWKSNDYSSYAVNVGNSGTVEQLTYEELIEYMRRSGQI